MSDLHGSPIWYELMTPDPDATGAFYGPILGWTITPMAAGAADYRVIATPDGGVGGLFALSPAMVDQGVHAAWLMYVGVDDVDATAAAVKAAGGAIARPAWDVPGIGRMAMLADPQGAPFYVMTPFPPAGEGGENNAFSPRLLGHCTWNELRTTDLDAAIGFYRSLFDWAQTGAMSMGPAGDYLFLNKGDLPIGAAMGGASADQPPHWIHYFRVAAIDDALVAVKKGGGIVLTGPHDVPGGDRVIICRDPHGAGVGFVARG